MITEDEFYRYHAELERGAANGEENYRERPTVSITPSESVEEEVENDEEEVEEVSRDAIVEHAASLSFLSTQAQNEYSHEIDAFSAQEKESQPLFTEDPEEHDINEEEVKYQSQEVITIVSHGPEENNEEMDRKQKKKKKSKSRKKKKKKSSEKSVANSWEMDPDEESGMKTGYIIGIVIAVVLTMVNIGIFYGCYKKPGEQYEEMIELRKDVNKLIDTNTEIPKVEDGYKEFTDKIEKYHKHSKYSDIVDEVEQKKNDKIDTLKAVKKMEEVHVQFTENIEKIFDKDKLQSSYEESKKAMSEFEELPEYSENLLKMQEEKEKKTQCTKS